MIFAYSNNQGEFTVDELKDQNKGHLMSAENVWEKSMQARRAVANSTPGFAKILSSRFCDLSLLLVRNRLLESSILSWKLIRVEVMIVNSSSCYSRFVNNETESRVP